MLMTVFYTTVRSYDGRLLKGIKLTFFIKMINYY
jgi:hypothetical protein